jgi:hypothetical protein
MESRPCTAGAHCRQIAGIVVYSYAGDNVASPALGSTGETVRRVAYGIAIPTILIAGVINANVAAKLVMQRIFVTPGQPLPRHMTQNTVYGWSVWIGIVVTIWTFAFLIAEVVPFFSA